ncbi:MAG TPA: MDR family MFS transporter [Mycobacteriales bacterium]|jgi:EmrB/QacA subfamily drug resistance transporter|nr:MDR family MFS transporter [Mycobacteriales bacterium]
MAGTLTGEAPRAGGPQRLDPEFVTLAAVVLTGVLAVVFDTTIVSVALRTLAADLDAPIATIQWVTTGYLLALGIAVPLTGWLLARFGGKRVWLAALALFLAGSVAASLAPTAPALIAARVVQGLGGGLMLPVMQTLLVRAAGGRGLGRATAVIALPALLGPVLGPMLGGLILEHASWRWIFWVNVPFCVAGLLLAWRFMPADAGDRSRRLDLIGLALLSPGVAAVLYGLSRVGVTGGFGAASVLVPLAAGIALLVAFTLYALRARRPLLDLRLFRVRSFSASTGLMFLSGFVLYGALLLIPLYFQDVRGHDALRTGLLLAPQGLGVLASRGLAGSLTDRIGARWIVVAGLLVTAAGTVPFALAGAATSEWVLVVALVVRGAGLGAVTLPIFATAYEGVDRARVADASILTRAAQQVGGSFGGAVLAVVLAGRLAAHPGAGAYQVTFWWTIGFTLAAVVLAFGLPYRRPAP